MNLTSIFESARKASFSILSVTDSTINEILGAIAEEIGKNHDFLLSENQKDLELADPKSPMFDRLKLTSDRLDEISCGIRKLIELPSPLGRTLSRQTRPNGLDVARVSVPFGVIGIVYEARPNVTFDVVALCLKSGNVCVLKGSKNADFSNKAIVSLIHRVFQRFGIPQEAVYRRHNTTRRRKPYKLRKAKRNCARHRNGCGNLPYIF